MIVSSTTSSQRLDAPLRVARWVRVSTEEQSKEGHAGLERQRAATERIITSRGYSVVASFEVVHSGATVTGTVEFAQLMELVRGGLDAVIVSEVSRLMRVESWESLAVLDVFTRHRCLIIADGQTIDLSNPQGFLTGGIMTLAAGAQRLELVQKISASKTALKRRGRLASGDQTLPFAVRYDWETHKYYYDPEEIWRVQEAYRLIAEEGISNLAEVCRRVGFKRSSLRVILANRIYAYGVRRYDKQRDMTVNRIGADGHKADRPKVSLPADQVIEVKVIDEPAVSAERFELVTRILEELRLNHVAMLPKEKRVHLCTSYGRCGMCGSAIYLCGNGKKDKATGLPLLWYCCRSQHPGRRGNLPRCNNSWTSTKTLDALLVAFTAAVLTNPAILTALLEESLRVSSEVIRPFPSADGPEQMITKLLRAEKKLIRMCSTDAISIAELKSERARIQEEISRLRNAAAASRPQQQQATTAAEFARLLIRGTFRFQRLTDRREQKAMLEQIFSEVFFRHDSVSAVRFHPNLLASFGEGGKELARTITLESPFRIAPEVPNGHKQCTRCGSILPNQDFPLGRSRCVPCFRESEKARRARATLAATHGRPV